MIVVRRGLYALALLASVRCGRSDFQWPKDYQQGVTGGLQVVPVYPQHAAWNDYVVRGGDVACDVATDAGSGPARCIHAGEARKLTVSGLNDCALYTIADSLGVWAWTCDDHAGNGPVDFVTNGFAAGKGLRDLVDRAGFKPNAVTVTEKDGGHVVAQTASAVWDWNNPVAALPANETGEAVTLASAGTIYVLDASRASNGYVVDADHVAIVTLAGATLSWGGGGPTCNAAGESSSPDHTSLVCVGANNFVWLEASLRGASTRHIDLVATVFTRVNQTTLDGAASNALFASGMLSSAITDLTARNTGDTGVLIADGSSWNLLQRIDVTTTGDADEENGIEVSGATSGFNTLADIHVVDAASYGVAISNMAHDNWLLRIESHANTRQDPSAGIGLLGPRNKVVGARLTNNGLMGLRLYQADDNAYDNTVVDVMASTSDGTGLIAQHQASRLTALNFTTVSSGQYGTLMNGPADVSVANMLIANNGHGFDISAETTSVTAARFFDIMVVDNDLVSSPSPQIIDYDSGASDVRFDGHLWIGPTSSLMCDVVPDHSGDGLIASTCTNTGADGSSTYSGDASTAVLGIGISSASVFVGKVTSDDAVSTIDSAGTASAATITGDAWWQLANAWRAWGRDGGVFPAPAQRAHCGTGTCRIWDFRLAASDTVARNRHGAFVNGAACPAAVSGSVTSDDAQQLDFVAGINAVEWAGDGLGDDDGVCEAGERCHNRFLRHASEEVLDGIGDDDGLCESGESCIYAPNVGAYQGDGDAHTRSCTFSDGAVAGVTMHAYPVNGG